MSENLEHYFLIAAVENNRVSFSYRSHENMKEAMQKLLRFLEFRFPSIFPTLLPYPTVILQAAVGRRSRSGHAHRGRARNGARTAARSTPSPAMGEIRGDI